MVRAGGIEYRGILMEITLEDVKLKGATGWIVLPMARVQKIFKEGEGGPRPLDPMRESSAELFMDDETLAALNAQDQAEKRAADLEVANGPPPPHSALDAEIADLFDPSEMTQEIDFNPVTLAPYNEETPAEYRDLPGIPQDELELVAAGPAQAPPVAAPAPVSDGSSEAPQPAHTHKAEQVATERPSSSPGFRPPGRPPNTDDT